ASVSKVERKPPRTIQRVATDGFNKRHQSSRAVRVPTFTTKSANNGLMHRSKRRHAAVCHAISLLQLIGPRASGSTRKTFFPRRSADQHCLARSLFHGPRQDREPACPSTD